MQVWQSVVAIAEQEALFMPPGDILRVVKRVSLRRWL